jgi:hypothetical protein
VTLPRCLLVDRLIAESKSRQDVIEFEYFSKIDSGQ